MWWRNYRVIRESNYQKIILIIKLSYTRQVTKPSTPPKTVAEPTTQAPIEDQYNTFEPVYFDDPFAQFEQPFSFDEPVQEGNLYDLLENVAQFYEHQLPTSQKAKITLSNAV